MRQTIIIIGVILLVLLFTAFPACNSYNNMVKMDNNVKKSWAQVENVYQRRLDLIPNLVNTVKGVANFEKETLTAVIEARAKATQVTIDPTKMTEENFKQFQEAQGRVSSSLSRLLVSVEQYPQLKATESFKELQSQLEGTENRITVERQRYIEAVNEYNNQVTTFPGVMFASMFKFKERPSFTADKTAEKAPEVKF
jgi:LemA protein